MKLKTPFQEFIYKRTYARWKEDQQRREDWNESVNRYQDFMLNRVPEKARSEYMEAIDAFLGQEAMGSMRALWTAGEALERENICAYNCAAVTIDNIAVFSEILYVLMCGTGCGFSVERQFINQLPAIPEEIISDNDTIILFADSKLGWAEGFNELLKGLYKGINRKCDLSMIRPKGERLKTFGGRASGPEPLQRLIDFTRKIFMCAKGRKLTSIECHDLVCFIANIVIVGGVRRAATISLSNPSDQRMAHAKDGEFWRTNPQRTLANNSIAYTEKPSASLFMEEWLNLIKSESGERGIFNREGVIKKIKGHGRRDPNFEFICNPCSEILLRPKEFCNLTEGVVRRNDTLETLHEKVRKATILGIVQSTLTNFQFLREEWKKNVEEERLLGVSLTGLRDHEILNSANPIAEAWLNELQDTAIKTAEEWSNILGINMPAAITTVKPSGTVSLLVDSSSGLHPRFAPYYIRRVRVAKTDPMCQFLIDSGVKWNPEVEETLENYTTAVFDFPIKAPEGSVCTKDVDALEQLNYWKMLNDHWCEHNPSCTVFVKEYEWLKVGNWIYNNWDDVSGISFLPYDGGVYVLPPYEEITSEEYAKMALEFPILDFSEFTEYEKEDNTKGATIYACSGNGSCEIK